MSVLVYIDTTSGQIAKHSLEAIYYGSQIGEVTVITNGSIGADHLAELGNYGAKAVKVHRSLGTNDAAQLSKLVVSAAQSGNFTTIIFSHDLTGKAVAPRVSAALKAGLVSGAVSLPDANGIFKVNVFSGKAFGNVKVNSNTRIISLTPNSIAISSGSNSAAVEEVTIDCGSPSYQVQQVEKQEGDVLLPEAEIVVSAGRGLKGPENWGMVEDLAKTLGAATACSRPVADIGWRPHHEHVGQTGLAIRPNLYIAAGISGAIQHLAGVNGSKVIVVINTDPEAPFFKAADYGVVGDAFDVLPKLNEEIKKLKAQN